MLLKQALMDERCKLCQYWICMTRICKIPLFFEETKNRRKTTLGAQSNPAAYFKTLLMQPGNFLCSIHGDSAGGYHWRSPRETQRPWIKSAGGGKDVLYANFTIIVCWSRRHSWPILRRRRRYTIVKLKCRTGRGQLSTPPSLAHHPHSRKLDKSRFRNILLNRCAFRPPLI